jgi:hypothetical protein
MSVVRLDGTSSETAETRSRRRTLTDMLNPGGRNRYWGIEFAVGLALKHGWSVSAIARYDAARAVWHTRTIYTAPIVGDVELAVYCHEAGHLEDVAREHHYGPTAHVYRHDAIAGVVTVDSLEGELAAWRWALKTLGRRWTADMQREMEFCLRSYQQYCKTYGLLQKLEAVVAEGVEQARHVVRISR